MAGRSEAMDMTTLDDFDLGEPEGIVVWVGRGDECRQFGLTMTPPVLPAPGAGR